MASDVVQHGTVKESSEYWIDSLREIREDHSAPETLMPLSLARH